MKKLFLLFFLAILPLSIFAESRKSELLPHDIIGVKLGMREAQIAKVLEQENFSWETEQFADGYSMIIAQYNVSKEWVWQLGIMFNQMVILLANDQAFQITVYDNTEEKDRTQGIENANRLYDYLNKNYNLHENPKRYKEKEKSSLKDEYAYQKYFIDAVGGQLDIEVFQNQTQLTIRYY